MSEQLMIDRELLKELRDSANEAANYSLTDRERSYHEAQVMLADDALAVSAQPAGEVPEVVGYGFQHVDKGWLFSTKSYHEVNPCLEGVGLMTVAQHTRIVEALQARAVVMPERKEFPELMMAEYHEVRGWNSCLDEVARLNGGQFDPLEWSRKHGIEEY